MFDETRENNNIDFSKFDKSLENLVLSIAEWNKKHNGNVFEGKKQKPKRVVKKLNVELIKKVLQETQEIQNKKKEQ